MIDSCCLGLIFWGIVVLGLSVEGYSVVGESYHCGRSCSVIAASNLSWRELLGCCMSGEEARGWKEKRVNLYGIVLVVGAWVSLVFS